jgi:hypothetical protein
MVLAKPVLNEQGKPCAPRDELTVTLIDTQTDECLFLTLKASVDMGGMVKSVMRRSGNEGPVRAGTGRSLMDRIRDAIEAALVSGPRSGPTSRWRRKGIARW